MEWNVMTEQKFKAMIERIPVFHRRITQEAVMRRARQLAVQRKASQIEEQDVIGAFFYDVPSPFYSMMIRLMEQSGFDYQKYGYPKESQRAA
jgi:hypothetical protein